MNQELYDFPSPSQEELTEMAAVNVQTVDPQTLVDIRDVKIDTSLPPEARMRDYLRQIKNPYCFKCDKIIIKLRFAEDGDTLEERLEAYLQTLCM